MVQWLLTVTLLYGDESLQLFGKFQGFFSAKFMIPNCHRLSLICPDLMFLVGGWGGGGGGLGLSALYIEKRLISEGRTGPPVCFSGGYIFSK